MSRARSALLWVGLLASALLTPCAAAKESLVFAAEAITAEGEQVEGGRISDVTAEGNLLAGLVEHVQGGHGATSSFELQATRLTVEQDYADVVVNSPADSLSHLAVFPQHDPAQDFQNAQVKGTNRNAEFQLIVVPMPGGAQPKVFLQSPCMELASAGEERLLREDHVNLRDPVDVSLASAPRVSPCAGSPVVRVEGDLMLRVWGFSGTMNARGEQQTFWTGTAPSQYAPAGTPVGSIVEEWREAYLLARGATLTFRHVPSISSLYVEAPQVQDAATVLLRNTAGTVSIGAYQGALDSSQTTLGGSNLDVSATRNPQSDRLDAVVAGRITKLSIDGQSVVVAPESPAPAWAVAWVAAFLALGLIIFAAVQRRRRSREARLRFASVKASGRSTGPVKPKNGREEEGTGSAILAMDAYFERRFRRMLRLAQRAALLFPRSLDGQKFVGLALFKLGRLGKAWNRLQPLVAMARPGAERAAVLCLLGRIVAANGEGRRARGILEMAFGDDVGVVYQEILGEDFDGLAGDPWFDMMRSDAAYYQARRAAGPVPADAAIA